MNRFKKNIASAVTSFLMVMAFAVISGGEAEAKVKARFDHSYLPPTPAAKFRRPAKLTGPGVGTRKSARVIGTDGRVMGIRGVRRAGILPYMEQGNLYR